MGSGINRGDYYKRLARQRERLLSRLFNVLGYLHINSASLEVIGRVARVARRVERSMRQYQLLALMEEL